MSWGSRRSAPPQPFPLDYAAHLPKYNAEVLKKLARLWVGKDATKLNKEACTKAILRGLADPAAVQAVLDGLSPFERAGLGLLKRHGQTAPTQEFAVELLMLGLPFPARERPAYGYSRIEPFYGALNSLLEKGLVLLREWDQAYGYARDLQIDEYHYRPEVFSDRGLLAGVEVTPPTALSLTPVGGVGELGFALQPAEVVLRFVALVETLRKLGRIDLTSKGRPTKPFLTKLTKTLGWEETLGTASDTPLPQATLFFFKLLQSAGFLRNGSNFSGVDLHPQANALFEGPYNAQAEAWIKGYRSLTRWTEHVPQGMWLEEDDESGFAKFASMRAALLMALAALPDATAWYRLTELAEEMYDRIGEHFSLRHFQNFYAQYNATPEQIVKQRAEWRKELHKHWREAEQPWITRAMTGPLFHLGLVALSSEAGEKKAGPTLFRLTPLGRAVLYDSFRPPGERTAATLPAVVQDGTCWVVQPNFDVVVYLDRASAARLAFIERIAARKSSTGATALYHLTRDTVYAALESGIEPGALLETLSRGCDYPLPENIRQTLADWAARREQLTVYRVANVLEFADQQARDAALAKKPDSGVAVGERYILLLGRQRSKVLSAQVSRTVDYLSPPVRCLNVSEEGSVEVAHKRADLLVQGELSVWADADSANGSHWSITCHSVQRAVSGGWTADSIIHNLKQRLQHDLPPLLLVAIRAWVGVRTLPTAVALATDLVLQVVDLEVARAIAGSPLLQPYLRERLGRQTFLVKHETVEAFRARLAEFGLQVGGDLELLSPGWKD